MQGKVAVLLGLAAQALLPPDSAPLVTGSVLVDGQEMVGAPADRARAVRQKSVRSVFQDPMSSLNPTMRIGRQLREACTDDTAPLAWRRERICSGVSPDCAMRWRRTSASPGCWAKAC